MSKFTRYSNLRVWIEGEDSVRVARDRYVHGKPQPEHLLSSGFWLSHKEGGYVPSITMADFKRWLDDGAL